MGAQNSNSVHELKQHVDLVKRRMKLFTAIIIIGSVSLAVNAGFFLYLIAHFLFKAW
jgi:hypothetical protein